MIGLIADLEQLVRKDERNKWQKALSTQTLELMGNLPTEFAVKEHDKNIQKGFIEKIESDCLEKNSDWQEYGYIFITKTAWENLKKEVEK